MNSTEHGTRVSTQYIKTYKNLQMSQMQPTFLILTGRTLSLSAAQTLKAYSR